MEFPGIARKRIEALEPKLQKAARNHLKDLRAAIREKELVFRNRDPNEMFFGFKGFRQIERYRTGAKGALKGLLADLKTSVNELKASVDQEIAAVRDLDALMAEAKDDKTLQEELARLKEELGDELYIARRLQEQLDCISGIHECASKITKAAGPEISAYVSELDDICGVLKSKVLGEYHCLDLLYNLLNTPGWEELKAELDEHAES